VFKQLIFMCALLGLGLPLARAQVQAGPAGGALTQAVANRQAFTLPAPTLSALQLRDFAFGNRLFNTNWVVAPASADGFDGLGPTFNRNSCSGCHLRDGRGRPPIAGETTLDSMLVRMSIPGRAAHGEPKPVPGYGLQLNDRAIPGVRAEGAVQISYVEMPSNYADGEPYSLRRPQVEWLQANFGDLPDNLLISARVAPMVFGLGLLEAIPASDLRKRADPQDRDNDGISGRINRVYDVISGKTAIGRFGWKANVPSLEAQVVSAAQGDIGLTSVPIPVENCAPEQSACRAALSGGTPELDESFVRRLTFYNQVLAVPARRAPSDAQALHGEQLFARFQCASCHSPTQTTDDQHPLTLLHQQTFHPYTDLLLHDMGEALSDQRPDFQASGREWRTPPLWGLGLVKQVNDHELLLHDGRARGFAEAILWHGGEAEKSAEQFRSAPKSERDALLAFLRSL